MENYGDGEAEDCNGGMTKMLIRTVVILPMIVKMIKMLLRLDDYGDDNNKNDDVDGDDDQHCRWALPSDSSPQAHLHVVGMSWFVLFDINQPSWPAHFFSALSVYFCLYGPFRSINSPDNSHFSHFVLPYYFCLKTPFNYTSLLKVF